MNTPFDEEPLEPASAGRLFRRFRASLSDRAGRDRAGRPDNLADLDALSAGSTAGFCRWCRPTVRPEKYIGINLRGVGVIIFLLFTIFVGWIAKGFIGRSLIRWG